MSKKSVRARFVNLLSVCGVCLLLVFGAAAQTEKAPEKSLELLYEEFKSAKKLACGQRADALLAGREIVLRFENDELNREVVEFVKKHLSEIVAEEKNCNPELTLENLYAQFRAAIKPGCGERSGAINVGKLILTVYADDELNADVFEFVKKRVALIEQEDPVCRRKQAYIAAFQAKNWAQVFASGKVIIDALGDKPMALDIMLDLVSVGYDRTAYEDNYAYNTETLNYAKKALELIERGVKTNACWGAFNCFRDREKTLGWLNYIVGYVSYFRLKGGKTAMPYFYRSTQYKMEFKYDAFIYQAVAKYYFDRQATIASGIAINTFINKAQNLINPVGETANNFVETEEDAEIAALYKQLVKLYKLRYKLEENKNVPDLGSYIQILLDRPLLEPSKNKQKKS